MNDLIEALKRFLAENTVSEHERWEIKLLIKKYEKKITDELNKEV